MRHRFASASRLAPPVGTRAVRLLVALWMSLHVLTVVGLPILDGVLGHADVVAHWEDQSDRDCPPRHGTDSCIVCHVVSHQAVEPTGAPAVPAEGRRVACMPRRGTDGHPLESFVRVGAGPRGPPQG